MALPLALGSIALGAIQTLGGLIQSRKLDKMKTPQYAPTQQLQHSYNRAEEMARRGFTPAEQAAFDQRLARTQNTAFKRAVDMGGGNLASAINAGINYSNIGAQQDFAAQDAALQRQNIQYADRIGGEFQRLSDMNTEVGINELNQARQAAGQAMKTGTENLVGAFNLNQALGYGNQKTGVDAGGIGADPGTPGTFQSSLPGMDRVVNTPVTLRTQQSPFATPDTTGGLGVFDSTFSGPNKTLAATTSPSNMSPFDRGAYWRQNPMEYFKNYQFYSSPNR